MTEKIIDAEFEEITADLKQIRETLPPRSYRIKPVEVMVYAMSPVIAAAVGKIISLIVWGE